MRPASRQCPQRGWLAGSAEAGAGAYAAKIRPSITRRRFRADAAFAIPALFDLLEAEGWDYAIRIKGNPKLHERIDRLLLGVSGALVGAKRRKTRAAA